MSLGSGRAMDLLGLFPIPAICKVAWMDQIGRIVHGLGGKLLIAVIVLRVIGAPKHQIVDRDGTLARMTVRRVECGRARVRFGTELARHVVSRYRDDHEVARSRRPLRWPATMLCCVPRRVSVPLGANTTSRRYFQR